MVFLRVLRGWTLVRRAVIRNVEMFCSDPLILGRPAGRRGRSVVEAAGGGGLVAVSSRGYGTPLCCDALRLWDQRLTNSGAGWRPDWLGLGDISRRQSGGSGGIRDAEPVVSIGPGVANNGVFARGCSSVGRASASQAECRRFEPVHPLSSKPRRIPYLRDTPDRIRAATFAPVLNGVLNAVTEPWRRRYADHRFCKNTS